MSFSLGSVRLKSGSGESVAVRVDGSVFLVRELADALGETLPDNALALFDQWDRAFPILERLAARCREAPGLKAVPENDFTLMQPVRPRKAYCIGANYADHLEEMGSNPEREEGRAPFFYMKQASTTLCGPGNTVVIPTGCTNFDWEGEVVVVFGRGGAHIPASEAMSHVAGYTMGIDFTARDQFIDEGLLFRFHFALGKCQDNTAPIGPWIVPAAYLDGDSIGFSLAVNGTIKQSSNTGRMLYSLAEQIAEISRRIRIEPGDVLFTGTPAGVGFPRGEHIRPGDVVTASASLIGDLVVIARDAEPGPGPA